MIVGFGRKIHDFSRFSIQMLSTDDDIVDGNVNEFDEVSDESHYQETNS